MRKVYFVQWQFGPAFSVGGAQKDWLKKASEGKLKELGDSVLGRWEKKIRLKNIGDEV